MESYLYLLTICRTVSISGTGFLFVNMYINIVSDSVFYSIFLILKL
jgi:hypothetical protein